MTELELEQVAQYVLTLLKDLAPKDTGNLAYNSIRLERVSPTEYRIYVSVEGEHTPNTMDGIAPYMVWVNDNPTVGNTGKTNRNYQWWNAAARLVAEEAAKYLNGVLNVNSN